MLYKVEKDILCHAKRHLLSQGIPVEPNFSRTVNAIHQVLKMSHIARKEGLLALEDYGRSINATSFEYSIEKQALMLIVDGTDPEFVGNILRRKLILKGLDSFDAYVGFLVAYGALCVQAGENPLLIKEELLACVPEELIARARESLREKDADVSEENISYLLERWETMQPKESDSFFLRLFEKRFALLTDREVQTLFKETDGAHIMQVALYCSIPTRKKISRVLSDRKKAMLMDEYWFMDDAGLNDTLSTFMKTIAKLEYIGEIVPPADGNQ